MCLCTETLGLAAYKCIHLLSFLGVTCIPSMYPFLGLLAVSVSANFSPKHVSWSGYPGRYGRSWLQHQKEIASFVSSRCVCVYGYMYVSECAPLHFVLYTVLCVQVIMYRILYVLCMHICIVKYNSKCYPD